jgi:hypothetical protein
MGSMSEAEDRAVEQIWVSTVEGAEITGFNQQYLQKLALKISRLPEDERVIRIRRRGGRNELWLPDLYNYIETSGRGPTLERAKE